MNVSNTMAMQQRPVCNIIIYIINPENISCSCRHRALNEYSSLQENPYNVRYSHTVLIIHIYFAPQAVDTV